MKIHVELEQIIEFVIDFDHTWDDHIFLNHHGRRYKLQCLHKSNQHNGSSSDIRCRNFSVTLTLDATWKNDVKLQALYRTVGCIMVNLKELWPNKPFV